MRQFLITLLCFGILLSMAVPAYAGQNVKKIYVFGSTHSDVGFDAPPSRIDREQVKFLDDAVKIAYSNPNFFWMIESGRLLDNWLRMGRSISPIVNLMKMGRMDVGSNYIIPHTATLGQEEIFRLTYTIHGLGRKYGFKSEVAVLNDIPGFSWALPTVLAKSGVKYLIAGANLSLGGALSIPESHNPFYWQGPDGSKVLVWISRNGYLEGYFTWWMQDYNRMRTAVPAEINRMESMGYKYDSVLVIFGTGDHKPATPFQSALANIQRWNRSIRDPEIIVTNPVNFFKHMEEKYGDEIPVYSGDWAGVWDINKRFSPASTALRNWSRDHTPVVEYLDSLNMIYSGKEYPRNDINEIYRNLLLFSDHGAGAGTGWPDLLTVQDVEQSNKESYNFTKTAYDTTKTLLGSALSQHWKLFTTPENAIVVTNPLPFERSDLVRSTMSGTGSLAGKALAVRDESTGETIPARIGESGELEFIAKNVPAMGYKVYSLVTGEEAEKATLPQDSVTIENDFYRVAVSAETGYITSIYDKELGRELVKTFESLDLPFNGLLSVPHYTIFGSGISHTGTNFLVNPGKASISQDGDGIFSKITVKRDGTPFVSTEITLYKGLKRVYLRNVLDTSKMAVTPYKDHSANYLFSFPFNLDIARMELRFDTPAGFLNPDTDFLPGAVVGPLNTQHSLLLWEDEDGGMEVILSNKEAYINMWSGAGMMTNFYAPWDSTIFSVAMGKIDYGKTKNKGEVRFPRIEPAPNDLREFNYAITTRAKGSDNILNAKKEGWSFNVPMIGSFVPSSGKGIMEAPFGSFISLDQPNVMAISFKSAEEWVERQDPNAKYFTLRVKEYAGLPADLTVKFAFPVSKAWIANAVEEPESALELNKDGSLSLKLVPLDTVTLLIEVK